MATDRIKETVEKIGHRAEEAMTGAHHASQERGDKLSEAAKATQRSAQETGTTASHVAGETTQQAGHKTEGLVEKAAHAVGIHKH